VRRFLHIIAGAIVGGLFGFWVLLPPDKPGYECGLMVLPAMFVGLPAGLVFWWLTRLRPQPTERQSNRLSDPELAEAD
jgi:membrane protease YdiL (CAAX protease family)